MAPSNIQPTGQLMLNNSMSANGISTLPTKQDRQVAKLNLAQAKRLAEGRARPYYDLNLLPAKYVGNVSVPNLHTAGLILGRPWTDLAPVGQYTLNFSLGRNSMYYMFIGTPDAAGDEPWLLFDSVDNSMYYMLPGAPDEDFGPTLDFEIFNNSMYKY